MSGESLYFGLASLAFSFRLSVVHLGPDLWFGNGYGSRGGVMSITEFTLIHGLFWATFGGCILALFAYDFFHFLVDLLPDFLQVVFRLIVSRWSKKS